MFRSSIINTIIENGKRFINLEIFKGDNHKTKQYNPGGIDYNPAADIEALIIPVNSNGADNAVIAYRDNIVKLSASGELRIYSTSSDGADLKLEIHLKNDGKLSIISDGEDLVDLILQLTTACEAILTNTAIGPQAPINKADFTTIKTKLAKFTP